MTACIAHQSLYQCLINPINLMKKLVSLLLVAIPTVAFAQTNTITDVNGVTAKLVGIGNVVIYLLVSLGVIFIVWNIVMFLIKGGDPEARGAARGNVVWGIVGLAIILSIWGLVNILTGTFKTTPANQPIPNLGNSTETGGIPGNQTPVVQ
jgi:hypothetical protein